MGNFHMFPVEIDRHHRKRVEGDRPPGRFLADQRDDGARQPFTVAGENAVGKAFLRQCFGGHDTQCDTSSPSSASESERPGVSTMRVISPAWVRSVRSMVGWRSAFSQKTP